MKQQFATNEQFRQLLNHRLRFKYPCLLSKFWLDIKYLVFREFEEIAVASDMLHIKVYSFWRIFSALNFQWSYHFLSVLNWRFLRGSSLLNWKSKNPNEIRSSDRYYKWVLLRLSQAVRPFYKSKLFLVLIIRLRLESNILPILSPWKCIFLSQLLHPFSSPCFQPVSYDPFNPV